jgi:predicted ribosome quality control (RQC) complex YloA/Tae2 family protein
LLSAVPGISPIVCRELAHKCLDPNGEEDGILSPNELSLLEGELNTLKETLLSGQATPTMVTDQNGKTIDFTFFAPTQYGDRVTLKAFDGFSELLDGFYTLRDQKARIQAKTQNLNKWLNTTLARLARTVNVRTAELEKAKNCEHLRKYGELLKANLGRIPNGASCCRVVDYYDPECKEIEIPLSPALSPQQNAQKYFKDYRKQCTAAGMLEGLIAKSRQDITYLDSVKEALSRAMSDGEITAIQEELIDGGWLKNRKSDKQKNKSKAKQLPPYEFCSDDGFVILAGRNNKQNDQLTLRQSMGNDIWFHTKNIPGSHVIVKSEGKTVPDTTLTQAAIIAATLSGGADSSGVAVDYCPVKRVKKPSGAAPGMVIYENYNTAFVNPDKALLEHLKKS